MQNRRYAVSIAVVRGFAAASRGGEAALHDLMGPCAFDEGFARIDGV